MLSEDNDGGVDDKKTLLHANRWDVYVNEKENLIKGGYSVKVVRHDGKKVFWGVVDDHVVEEATDNDEIRLQGFDLNLFRKEEKGMGRKGSNNFPCLQM